MTTEIFYYFYYGINAFCKPNWFCYELGIFVSQLYFSFCTFMPVVYFYRSVDFLMFTLSNPDTAQRKKRRNILRLWSHEQQPCLDYVPCDLRPNQPRRRQTVCQTVERLSHCWPQRSGCRPVWPADRRSGWCRCLPGTEGWRSRTWCRRDRPAASAPRAGNCSTCCSWRCRSRGRRSRSGRLGRGTAGCWCTGM